MNHAQLSNWIFDNWMLSLQTHWITLPNHNPWLGLVKFSPYLCIFRVHICLDWMPSHGTTVSGFGSANETHLKATSLLISARHNSDSCCSQGLKFDINFTVTTNNDGRTKKNYSAENNRKRFSFGNIAKMNWALKIDVAQVNMQQNDWEKNGNKSIDINRLVLDIKLNQFSHSTT